jgi:putative membrane protein
MKRLLSQVVAAAAGLWLATIFVQGIIVRAYPDSNVFGFPLTARWEILLFLGVVLGLLNYFVKPLLETITLPLEIVTLGLFSFVIGGFLLWVLELIFDELTIPLYLPLLYTSLIIWGINLILQLVFIKDNK